MNKLISCFLLSCLLIGCSQPGTTARYENIELAVDYFKGEKIAFSLPEDYQLAISTNLIVYPGADSIEIRAIEPGSGYVLIANNADTLLFASVNAHNNVAVEDALELVATNDPVKYRNNQLASWLYGTGLQNRGLPDFMVRTIEGDRIRSGSIKGKVSMIHFWYYGCPACMLEMEDLERLGNWLSDNPEYQFISICKDSGYIDKSKPHFFSEINVIGDDGNKRIVSYEPVNFKALHCINGASLEQTFSFEGYPITFITDTKGVVRYIFNGATKDMYTKARSYMEFLQHLK